MRRYLAVLAVSFMAATIALPALADDMNKAPRISVDGRGEVVATPDTASVNAGVTTQGKTARDALTANTTAMAALIATLKTAGIEARDIQTSGFSVNPQYLYPDKDANGDTPPPRITGYAVENGVTIKVRKLADLGSILDSLVSAGSNTINGVSFSVDDPAKLLDEARKAAFADAQSKARIYADAADVGLGSVLSISENQDGGPRPQPMMFRAAAAPMAKSVPVEAGQLTFDVDVSVVWALKAPGE